MTSQAAVAAELDGAELVDAIAVAVQLLLHIMDGTINQRLREWMQGSTLLKMENKNIKTLLTIIQREMTESNHNHGHWTDRTSIHALFDNLSVQICLSNTITHDFSIGESWHILENVLTGSILCFSNSSLDLTVLLSQHGSVFALLDKLIQKSVRRWRYFSVARAPMLTDWTRKTSAFRYACAVPG